MYYIYFKYIKIYFLPIYLFTYLLIYLFTYLLIYLFTYLLIYLFTYLPIYLFTYLFFLFSNNRLTKLSSFLPVAIYIFINSAGE